jgi:hypothetical protein
VVAAIVTTTVYLLHFSRPFRHAAHYLGSTALSMADRLAEHHAGRGSKLTRAAAADAITYTVSRTWPGSKRDERAMKGRTHGSRTNWRKRCPLCRPLPRPGAGPLGRLTQVRGRGPAGV